MVKPKLFPGIKQMTTLFGIAIMGVTIAVFTLRLTLFDNIANENLPVVTLPSTMEVVSGTSFEYRMNSVIEFPSLEEAGDFHIENPATNTQYMRVEIIRGDTGKSIYYSGYITPGNKIGETLLQGELPGEGSYSCKAVITAYDPDTKEKIGSHEQPVTIVVG